MPGITTIVKNLSLHLGGKKLLDGISFELNNGQHLLITGPSGSGKTLLTKPLPVSFFMKAALILLKTAGPNHPPL